MENLKIRCRSCNRELEGHPSKTVTCGCSNMATIRGDKISALDLSNIVMLNSMQTKPKSGVDRKSTRLNSSHVSESRMPSSA